MHNEFTAVFERDGEWIIGYCPEIPGANGQGRTREDARENLRQAIALILQDRTGEVTVFDRVRRRAGSAPAVVPCSPHDAKSASRGPRSVVKR
jgi:predicted RNase H-like HicB family nuclease